ncbi:YheC/YheD family protein [Alicyclobacillus sp. TC]|uniref:YheC/YheD family endospore coat-associated protein n=1 Tax=Alicyclobacillus sp. TC TaxID=2606450 RepID=UPI0019328DF1|nr:YheC/YheD family protein [Alicyclobacillus sp. TC]QRF23650.1 YheC/YheD family protein [Alicyclobacillus sp. TC]
MARVLSGEYVWHRLGSTVEMEIQIPRLPKMYHGKIVKVGDRRIPLRPVQSLTNVVYRAPVLLAENRSEWRTSPIYAILAGNGADGFAGIRTDFRDLIRAARARKELMYVLPVGDVPLQEGGSWHGYVRLGYMKWVRLPMPAPLAIYNRIPTRRHEQELSALAARRAIEQRAIPMFNPRYFNKREIHAILQKAGLAHLLPHTALHLTKSDFTSMLQEYGSLYVKPSGGSVGHGIIRVDRQNTGWLVTVLKNNRSESATARHLEDAWRLVQRMRLPVSYIIQESIPRIDWQGRPCDFRILLQKRLGLWHVVGKGVRVSGQGAITTHVPNGGSIASARDVLRAHFGSHWKEIEERMDKSVERTAKAIDSFFDHACGEMSMDVGVTSSGSSWIFEANAKPMKFDEPDIRTRSLEGVLEYLRELSKVDEMSDRK